MLRIVVTPFSTVNRPLKVFLIFSAVWSVMMSFWVIRSSRSAKL